MTHRNTIYLGHALERRRFQRLRRFLRGFNWPLIAILAFLAALWGALLWGIWRLAHG